MTTTTIDDVQEVWSHMGRRKAQTSTSEAHQSKKERKKTTTMTRPNDDQF
jgi:hypothetical protein